MVLRRLKILGNVDVHPVMNVRPRVIDLGRDRVDVRDAHLDLGRDLGSLVRVADVRGPDLDHPSRAHAIIPAAGIDVAVISARINAEVDVSRRIHRAQVLLPRGGAIAVPVVGSRGTHRESRPIMLVAAKKTA